MASSSLDILIPHFEDPQGLRMSLRSVALQDWRGRLRIVVADDGSRDENFERLEKICEEHRSKHHQPITLLRRTENRGRPYTRNELLDASESAHIAWLDAGDIWGPSKLRQQFDYLSKIYHTGQDLNRTWITCDYFWMEGRAEPRRVNQDVSGDQLQKLLIGSRLRAYLWTLLGTRESFIRTGYFDERMPRLQDLDYFIRFVRGNGKIINVEAEEALATYYKSDVGRSAQQVHNAFSIIMLKNQAVLRSYPYSFSKDLYYRSAKLAARFARSNNDRSAILKYELLAARAKPMASGKKLVRKVFDRLTS